LGYRIRQQASDLAQVTDLCADVVEMMGGNLPDFTAWRLFGSAKPKQSADFVEREAEFPCPPQGA
jgi:hypothetical protein